MFQLSTVRFWTNHCGCFLILVAAAHAHAQDVSPVPKNLAAIQHQALALMADIVPHEPVAATPIKVTYEANHAFWGTLFDDRQIAALVAVDLVQAKNHEPGDNSDLCLLLWDHGWRFQQWAGKVAATVTDEKHWDWAVKHRKATRTWYVVSHLNLYYAGEHLSWRCDARTHTLVPTGWPKDAVPSIAGDTITFTRQDKPGSSPTIRDIDRFTDQPTERLASRADSTAEHGGGDVLTLWNGRPDKACTWQVREAALYKRYALSRADGKQPAKPFREDAVAEFDWGDREVGHDTTKFLWQRLSGLSANALEGDWDEDGKSAVESPRSVTVTGLPEAVKRLSWPVKDGDQQ